MKVLVALAGAAVVLTAAGIEGLSGGVSSLAALAAVGCWMLSGWLVD